MVAAAAVLIPKWKDASNHGGQLPAEPFRIAGNLYYVGANDVTSFLLTGPEGHILLDGGYPGTPPLIIANVTKLGFDIRDVKVLLSSHAHLDHAGGLAELQKASGAELWVSDADADDVAAGGPTAWPLRALVLLHVINFPPPRVDHRFKDHATIRLGPNEVMAHITPGHTPGCTTWTFPVRDADRDLQVVSACSLELPVFDYPALQSDFEKSFGVLRNLPEDIWVTAHGKQFGRYRKFLARATGDSVAPFIDRDGYRSYIDSAEQRLREHLKH